MVLGQAAGQFLLLVNATWSSAFVSFNWCRSVATSSKSWRGAARDTELALLSECAAESSACTASNFRDRCRRSRPTAAFRLLKDASYCVRVSSSEERTASRSRMTAASSSLTPEIPLGWEAMTASNSESRPCMRMLACSALLACAVAWLVP